MFSIPRLLISGDARDRKHMVVCVEADGSHGRAVGQGLLTAPPHNYIGGIYDTEEESREPSGRECNTLGSGASEWLRRITGSDVINCEQTVAVP